MAEFLWLLLLFPSNIGAASKRDTVREVWSWSGDDLLAEHPLLSDPVLGGLGSAGTAYNTLRWLEALETAERDRILADGWAFLDWLTARPGAMNRQLTHILPHLLFPDLFERISSLGDKLSILGAMTQEAKAVWRKRPLADVDRRLLALRWEFEGQSVGPIDFYDPELGSE